MSLTVKCYPNGPFGENTYLIMDDKTGRCAIVDPGYIGDDILSEIDKSSGLDYILLTHGHYDHFACCLDYLNSFPTAIFAAPADDTELMYNGTDNKWFANGSSRYVCPEASLLVREDDTIRLGETEIRIIGTPGHTAGGITFYAGNFAFTGDTLFRLSVGVTNYKTGNRDTMFRSIKSKLYTLPDDTAVCPGHGPSTTIGYEKNNNPFVKSSTTIGDGAKAVCNNCYSGNPDIRSVTVADSVTDIGVGAFSGCKNLETVKLNEGLTRLKKEVFAGCEMLKEINIPCSLRSIGEWAFRGCKSLKELYIPESVCEICAESFLDCPSLTLVAKEGSFAASYAEKAGIPLKTI